MVKTLPASTVDAGDRVQSLGQDDLLEEEMTTRASFFASEISWTEDAGKLQSMGSQRVVHNRASTHTHTHTHTRN